MEDIYSACFINNFAWLVQQFVASRITSKKKSFLIFSPAYIEVLTVEEHNKRYPRRGAFKNQMILLKRH
jgi:hypothetical protein